MKSINELIGNDVSKEVLLDEIKARENALSELPTLGLLAPKPSDEELQRRFELEREIQSIQSEFHFREEIWPYFVNGYKTGFDAGRKSAKSRAAFKKHEPELRARFFCVDTAKELWANEIGRGDEITRMGDMCDLLYDELAHKGLWRPKDNEKIRDWLKDAKKKRELSIPPEAQKSGRPRKK